MSAGHIKTGTKLIESAKHLIATCNERGREIYTGPRDLCHVKVKSLFLWCFFLNRAKENSRGLMK